jgi:C-terminal processing protease CtpA/Prc
MQRHGTAWLIWLSLGLPAPLASAQSAKGWFGFQIAIESEGWSLNPSVRSATVREVAAGSPASAHPISAGDQIIEIDGQAVIGRKARELRPHVEKAVGEPVHLKLRRPNGETFSVKLVAVARPEPK